jgi:hypothetical protein
LIPTGQRSSDFGRYPLDGICFFCEALPYNDGSPAQFFEGALMEFVPGGVAFEFFNPEFAAVGGGGAVFAAAMSMPEAAVDEDDGFVFGEDDVGFSGEGFDVEAEAVAEFVEEGADAEFGRGVFAFDAGHVPGAAGFGEVVGGHGVRIWD